MTKTKVIKPQAGKQWDFCSSPADIVIFGGSAGSSKTYGLLLDALRNIDNPLYNAVLFRQTSPQLTMPGGMWDEAMRLYTLAGGRSNQTQLEFKWANGAKIKFAYIGRDADLDNYYGAQINVIGWDQLELHSEKQFFFMLSRNRSVSGIKPRIRATVNPDADSWVAKFIEWWINQETGYPIEERSGVIRWVVRVNNDLYWADTKDELLERFKDDPELIPKSVTFIPATVYDNKELLRVNPEYVSNLKALPLVERERLLKGNWKIKPAAGKVFNSSWFEIVKAAPTGGLACRGWDFAATAKKVEGDDPDETAGVKIKLVEGVYYIEDCIAEALSPVMVDKAFVNLVKQDHSKAMMQKTNYATAWEIEPGSAGVRENRRLAQMIVPIIGIGRHSTGDKLTRAREFAAQCEAGNVKIVEGRWNEKLLSQLHNFPDGKHDDIVDACALAFNELTLTQKKIKPRSYQG